MKTRTISYVKANLAKVIDELQDAHDPIEITQNGTGKAVLQDRASYDRMRSALAMLKLIAMGEDDAERGRTRSQQDVFRGMRKRLAARARAER